MTFEAYRVDSEKALDDAAAQEAWSRAARPVLIQVARRYGSLTSAEDVAAEAQALSGVRTREPASAWIDPILDAVDVECISRSEPLLSAFCVDADGRLSERYRQLVVRLDGNAGDINMHAAKQRLEAHRLHGAVLPVDGGQPTVPRQLATVQASASKRATTTRTRSTTPKKPAAPRKPKKPELPPRAVCPTCFLQLPVSGRCDNCDE